MNTCTHCRSFDSARGVCLRWKIVQPADGSCESFAAHDGTSFDDLHTRLQQAESQLDAAMHALRNLHDCQGRECPVDGLEMEWELAMQDAKRIIDNAARGGLHNQGSK
jgi:aminoglycoside phosphotransferase